MIILDIRLGRFSLLIQRESDMRVAFAREPGEMIIDLPFVRLFLSDLQQLAGHGH